MSFAMSIYCKHFHKKNKEINKIKIIIIGNSEFIVQHRVVPCVCIVPCVLTTPPQIVVAGLAQLTHCNDIPQTIGLLLYPPPNELSYAAVYTLLVLYIDRLTRGPFRNQDAVGTVALGRRLALWLLNCMICT